MSWPTNMTRRCVLCEAVIAHQDDNLCANCRRAFDAGRRDGMEIAQTQIHGSVRGFARLRSIEVHGQSVEELLVGLEEGVREHERQRIAAELEAMRGQPIEQRLARLRRFLEQPGRPIQA